MATGADARRVVRVRVSLPVLSDMLKCRHVAAGETVTSNLPRDAEIIRVVEMPEDQVRGGGVLTLLVESDQFGPCPMGEVPPEYVVTFTRERQSKR
jgi:hypothetical protein